MVDCFVVMFPPWSTPFPPIVPHSLVRDAIVVNTCFLQWLVPMYYYWTMSSLVARTILARCDRFWRASMLHRPRNQTHFEMYAEIVEYLLLLLLLLLLYANTSASRIYFPTSTHEWDKRNANLYYLRTRTDATMWEIDF